MLTLRYRQGSGGVDSSLGHLVYYDRTSGTLMAVPFDARALQVQGPAVPLGISPPRRADPSAAAYAFSASGTLAYVAGDAAATESTLVWVDRKGVEQPLPAPPRQYQSDPRISPDGQKVALSIAIDTQAPGGFGGDVWVYDFDPRRIHTHHVRWEGYPVGPQVR